WQNMYLCAGSAVGQLYTAKHKLCQCPQLTLCRFSLRTDGVVERARARVWCASFRLDKCASQRWTQRTCCCCSSCRCRRRRSSSCVCSSGIFGRSDGSGEGGGGERIKED